jgi:hypothetical protein
MNNSPWRWCTWLEPLGLAGAPLRLSPSSRQQAHAADRFMFSRAGIPLWLGLVALLAAVVYGLQRAGFETWVALLVAVLFLAGMGRAVRRAWIDPERFTARRLWRLAFIMMVASYAGAFASFFGVHHAPHSWQGADLAQLLWRATPLQLLVGLCVLLVLWVTAYAGRLQSQRALARLQLVQERDAAAREASEAQLRLLRAQIQPHFIFNTLSAVQHWVDTGDPRASGLLRDLTAFLRGTTDLLAAPEVTLRDEASLLRHYLSVMQARLGDRLRYTLTLAPEALEQPLPPGLLVTLAENAVEHGVAPALQGGEVQVHATLDGAHFRLCIRNTGLPLAPDWREGVGLANTRERLRHRFGEAARLQLHALPDGRTEARVEIDLTIPSTSTP